MNGYPNSGWELTFDDGKILSEENTGWSQTAEEKTVGYFGHRKQVFVAPAHARVIRVFHNELSETIQIPDGHLVYQAMRSGSHLIGGKWSSIDYGRVVGLVKDGEVVEERFLDGMSHVVKGVRK